MWTEELRPILASRPPRRAELLPGLRLSNALSRQTLAVPLFFVAILGFLPWVALLAAEHNTLSFRDTETAAGRVESVQATPGCEEKGAMVHYSFATSGGVGFRGKQKICSASPYAGVREGDSVPVIFLPDDPAVNAIAGEVDRPPFLMFASFPLLALLVVVPLTWPSLSQALRDRKLFRTGELARARVVFVKKQSPSGSAGWYAPIRASVSVSARLPSGEEREMSVACSNDWLLAHLPPGAEVTVCHAGGRAMLVENYIR